jgi:hypothetical protein
MGAYHPADTNRDGVVTPEEKAAWQAANPGVSFGSAWQMSGDNSGWKTPFGKIDPKDPTKDPTADAKRAALNQTGEASNAFAGVGEQGYGAMSEEAKRARDDLAKYASGQHSLSREMLRQGMQSNMSQQRSMAASASPQNAPMAALHAMQNTGRMGTAFAGQSALAGIQERQAAQNALANMIMQQRQQDAQVALGARQTAVGAYGGVTPQGSVLDRWANPIASALGAGARLK